MDIQTLLPQLAIIAVSAMLANACAIVQNSATIRYQLAISQWREFRASIAARTERLAELYASPDSALNLSERRVRLLLRGLDCLHISVGLFGLTSFLAVINALIGPPVWASQILSNLTAGLGGLGLAATLIASANFIQETRCARGLLELQLQLDRIPEIAALHPTDPSHVHWG